jgi:hypothetical protein
MSRTSGAHQHAAGKQLREALRETAERGDAADGRDAAGQHDLAR